MTKASQQLQVEREQTRLAWRSLSKAWDEALETWRDQKAEEFNAAMGTWAFEVEKLLHAMDSASDAIESSVDGPTRRE